MERPGCRAYLVAKQDHKGQPLTGRRAELAGTHLAAGYRMVHIMDRGDWAWLRRIFMCRSYANEKCCHRCGATQSSGPLCYANFSENAAYWATEVSTAEFLASTAVTCPWTCTPHWNASMIRGDLMHVVYQGVAALAIHTRRNRRRVLEGFLSQLPR